MNSMIAQVQSLPGLIAKLMPLYQDAVKTALDVSFCKSIERVFVMGCGDPHHAALGCELAFEHLTGLPCEPMTALQFGRYAAGYLPQPSYGSNLVIGISVSGAVARTIEALRMANDAGAMTMALTATADSPITRHAQRIISSAAPGFPEPEGVHTPGVRSYLANQLALLMIAVRIGEARGYLLGDEADNLVKEIDGLSLAAEKTVAICTQLASSLAEEWKDAKEFVFVGGGPNYASALFSAAKIIEASGDSAIGQETEEWTHLQYFCRERNTPTFFITAAQRDDSRIVEAALAARTIRRRVAAVAPESATLLNQYADRWLPFAHVREMFSPLLAAIPGTLFAAYRAEVLGEPFFRNFTGGRELTGGNGISRIRSSEIWATPWHE